MNILITGGTSGLGEACVRRLAGDENNFVNFTYNSSIEKANELEKEFENCKGFKCDFKYQSSINDLLTHMNDMDIDVLINNAVCSLNKKHFHRIKADDFMKSYRCNVLPVIMITQKAITIFRKKKFGKIINVLTDYIINKPPVGMSEYTANKAYIESLSKSWSEENMKFGITSNCISPSIMITNLTKDIDERIIMDMKEKHPLKRLLTPSEAAESIEFLVNCTQHINGMNLIINGGKNVI